MVAYLKRAADCTFLEGKPEFERQYAECLDKAVYAQDGLSAAQGSMANCGDEKHIAENYFDSTKAAAKSGDVDAQLCYVQGGFVEPESGITAKDIEEYQATSAQYTADAFKRGDWRIVAMLSTGRNRRLGRHSRPDIFIDEAGDPETIYKMDALLRLGAIGGYANPLDGFMNDLTHPDLEPEAALPQSKIAAADAWAQQMYSQYFSGTPQLTKEPIPCGGDADG
jgi:hypothetical protein